MNKKKKQKGESRSHYAEHELIIEMNKKIESTTFSLVSETRLRVIRLNYLSARN